VNIRSLLRQPVLTIALYTDEARWTLGRAGRITDAGRVPFATGLVTDGVVADPAAVAHALRDAEFPCSSRMQTVVALPAVRSICRQLEVPHVAGKAFAEFVEREIRRELPAVADHSHLSWQVAKSANGTARVFIIGVARDVLDSHIAAIETAGLAPVSADLRVIAAARAVGRNTVVLAQVEDHDVELAVFNGGVPAIIRSVALRAPCGDATWTDELAQELNRALKFYRDSRHEDAGGPPSAIPICLTGAAARIEGLATAIAAATGHEVVAPVLDAAVPGRSDPLRFAANVGAAMKDLAA
jgi:Tfp pilus assembly PilM family ATPase